MTKTAKQIAALVSIVLVFALFNGCMYLLLTGRLSNNFSDTSQSKQIDVAKFLPHVPESDLAEIDSSLKLTDHLPVLDGAAALVPVYAAIIDNVYPEGCVTFEGGTFDDSNYYGENFASDSAMQYKNTVRGYKAIVDGDTDILFCAAPSAAQKQYAAEQGVELVYVPIGREAFVFFVHRDNPVTDLTPAQVRDIYGGEITNWAQVGGANRVINPITRLEGSGSQTMMEKFMGDRPIARKPLPSLLREVSPEGKPSVTEYRVLEEGEGFSKVALCPVTGRTHQLRVHCAYAGAPILGDPQYGTEESQAFSAGFCLASQLLCAKKVELTHPVTGKMLTITACMDAKLEG